MPVRHRDPTATSSTMINSPPPSSMSSEPLLPEDSSASGSSNTISHDESLRTVPWQTDNDSVMTGYRRQLYSVKACLWSSVSCELKIHVSGKTAHPDFADLHNETGQLNQYLQGSRKLTAAVNIHSHSFGAIFFAILLSSPCPNPFSHLFRIQSSAHTADDARQGRSKRQSDLRGGMLEPKQLVPYGAMPFQGYVRFRAQGRLCGYSNS